MTKLKRNLRGAAVLLAAALLLSTAALAKPLVPVGRAVGIEMTTDGVLVASLSQVETGGEKAAPASDAGIAPGDVIVMLGDAEISCGEDFAKAAAGLDGSPVAVTLRRSGRLIQYTVEPAEDGEGVWRLGLWLRDRVSGIGTVTYYDPESGTYGALGHGINDTDTGVMLPLGGGNITSASVTEVKTGASGKPGELRGAFDADAVLGDIAQNTVYGIFGKSDAAFDGGTVETAPVSEIKTGPATILAQVRGSETAEYDVEVARISRGGEEKLMVTVTDPELLALTGGIVQGMSGAPIMQDGRLVGAVTHVLLSDPTKGYGVPIDSMLSAAA